MRIIIILFCLLLSGCIDALAERYGMQFDEKFRVSRLTTVQREREREVWKPEKIEQRLKV